MVARPRVPLTHSGVVVVVVVVALALAVAAGASIDARPRAPQDPVFRASLDQVRVDVAVTRGDTPVPNLTASHFEVRDNGVLQTVDRVHREEVPLRFVLVLDTSASVAGNQLSALVTAAQSLVRALRADDHVGLVAFSHVLRLSVAPTTRHADTLTALASLRAGGTTAWRDALFAGVQLAPE